MAISDIKREAAGIFDKYLKEQIKIFIHLPAQNKTKYTRAQRKKLVPFFPMSRKDCMSFMWQRCVLSIDGERDVALLVVVLQQQRHPHGLVPAAQHALFDAGRVNLTDEALQRLQAAAEHSRLTQAGRGQPSGQVLVCAVGLLAVRMCVERWVVTLMGVELMAFGMVS